MNKELFRRILYGGIIGDAMGVPYEFKKQGTFQAEPYMIGHGTYNQPPGTWSDDTSLTLLLMEALSQNKNPTQYLQSIQKYHEEGYMTPDGFCFDIGSATLDAVQGYPNLHSKGNGALMRACPLVYYTWNMDKKEQEREIKKWSEITHPNKTSTLCVSLYVDLMRAIIKEGALDAAVKIIDTPVYKDLLGFDVSVFCPGSTGCCTDTLATAVVIACSSLNYTSTIIKTIDLGGDTDTNAMVAGTLAAAVYPLNDDWMDKLRKKDIIDYVLRRFLQMGI